MIGAAGIGLVGGWLAAGVSVPRRVGERALSALALATLLGEAFLVSGLRGSLALLVAFGVGVIVRTAWLSWLQRRIEPRPDEVEHG